MIQRFAQLNHHGVPLVECRGGWRVRSGQRRGADQGGGLERDDQVVEVPISSPVKVFESPDVVAQHLEVLNPIDIGLVEREERVPCRAGLDVGQRGEHDSV